VNVKAPFAVKAPAVLITKTSLGLFWASNVRLMPVVVEMFVSVNVYTLLPMNVRFIVRSGYDCVDGKSKAALNAFTKSVYALLDAVLPGAKTLPPTVVPVGLKPVIVPDASLTPTLPMTTEVPVFEIVPPRSPKELAEARFTIGVPEAGTRAAATAITSQIRLCRRFPPFVRRVSAATNCTDTTCSRISSSS